MFEQNSLRNRETLDTRLNLLFLSDCFFLALLFSSCSLVYPSKKIGTHIHLFLFSSMMLLYLTLFSLWPFGASASAGSFSSGAECWCSCCCPLASCGHNSLQRFDSSEVNNNALKLLPHTNIGRV